MMRDPAHTVLKGAIVALVLGGALIAGVAARRGEWNRAQWLRWLARLPIGAAAIALAAGLSMAASTFLPSGPWATFGRIVPWGLGVVYTIGQVIEFAFAPAWDDLADEHERSPWYVPPWIWSLMAVVVVTTGIMAIGRFDPEFPEERWLVGLTGGGLLWTTLHPPAWIREQLAAPGALLGPEVSRILAGTIGLGLLGCAFFAPDSFFHGWR